MWRIRCVDMRGQVDRAGFLRRPAVPSRTRPIGVALPGSSIEEQLADSFGRAEGADGPAAPTRAAGVSADEPRLREEAKNEEVVNRLLTYAQQIEGLLSGQRRCLQAQLTMVLARLPGGGLHSRGQLLLPRQRMPGARLAGLADLQASRCAESQ